MIAFIQSIFRVQYPYRSEIERQRSAALLYISYFTLLVQVLSTVQNVLVLGQLNPAIIITTVLAVTMVGSMIALIQRGRLIVAIWIFVLAGLSIITPFVTEPGINLTFILAVIPLIAAGVLLGRRGFLFIAALVVVLLVVRFSGQGALVTSVRLSPADLVQGSIANVVAVIGIGGLLLFLFSGSAERIARSSVSDIDHLTRVARFNADPSLHNALEGRSDEQLAIMQQALHVLETDLAYTQAQIYLYSAGGIARRVRATNVVDSGSFVLTDNEGQLLRSAADQPAGQPLRIVGVESLEAARYLTPPARIALLIPLRIADRILGILDVQASDINAFSPNKTAALLTMADELSIVTGYAETINALQSTIGDQQRILTRVRGQLADARQRGERAVVEGWDAYLQNRSGVRQGMGYDITLPDGDPLAARGIQPIPAADLPPAIREALQRGEVIVEQTDDEQIVKAPILLRGDVLGAMSFRIPGSRPITDRQVEMVRTVANRLAAALENNRLFEQSQGQAQRERKANEIAGELLKATNVEALVTLAAERFNDALGAIYTRISIQPGVMVDEPLPAHIDPPASLANGHAAGAINGNGHANGTAAGQPAPPAP